jgi:hypothetical protein
MGALALQTCYFVLLTAARFGAWIGALWLLLGRHY